MESSGTGGQAVYPALAGGFFTAIPPGKSHTLLTFEGPNFPEDFFPPFALGCVLCIWTVICSPQALTQISFSVFSSFFNLSSEVGKYREMPASCFR